MLMRVMIMSMSPEVPAWIENAKDVLNFRIDQWTDQIEAMHDENYTLHQIYDAVEQDLTNHREKEVLQEEQQPTGIVYLLSNLAMLPLTILGAGGKDKGAKLQMERVSNEEADAASHSKRSKRKKKGKDEKQRGQAPF